MTISLVGWRLNILSSVALNDLASSVIRMKRGPRDGLAGFQAYLAEHGHTAASTTPSGSINISRHGTRNAIDSPIGFRTLEMPCGIMACNDICGHNLLAVCNQEGLAVPEETAVVGVDNDELLCRACDPALSSVMVNAEGVGYRAAETPRDTHGGQHPERFKQIIAPLGVSVRQSTDVGRHRRPHDRHGFTIHSSNACEASVSMNVLKNASLSRSSLERKVRKHLGRTPQEEIRLRPGQASQGTANNHRSFRRKNR